MNITAAELANILTSITDGPRMPYAQRHALFTKVTELAESTPTVDLGSIEVSWEGGTRTLYWAELESWEWMTHQVDIDGYGHLSNEKRVY